LQSDHEMPATTDSTNKVVVETTSNKDLLGWTMLQWQQYKQGTVRNDINDAKTKVDQILEQQLENHLNT
jgi:hypothetical protein